MMGESFIQVPTDSTGKKIRTRERTVGANTVQEQFVIQQSRRVETGVYICQTGAHVVLASAHSATAGFWWLINPTGSSVLVALRRVEFMSQLGSALATPTSPRINIERMTFTGTASGAQITAAKRDTNDATAVATLRTASTGLTPTAGAGVFSFLPTAGATAVGYTAATAGDWVPDEDGQVVLAAGEGIVCRQADNGTTSDTRRFVTNIAWMEFSVP